MGQRGEGVHRASALPAYVLARRRLAGKHGPDRIGQFLERLALKSINARPAKKRGRRKKPRVAAAA